MSIVWYFFLGGIAGGAYFTAAIADNFGSLRDRAVARVGYLLSLPLVAVCGVLLIVDLGVPARFMNMILHFKFWDPMSIGAWAVGIFGAFAFVSSVLSFTSSESLASLRRKISLIGMLFGFFLAGYTGVLLSNSALPFWGDSRLMGALFLASGGSTGMAAVALIMFLSGRPMGESWHKIEVADRFSMLVEMVVLAVFLFLLGSAARPITSGHFGPLFWGGLVGAGLILPFLLNLFGGRVRALGAVSAALVLVGGFILRYVVVRSVQG
jgi:formate-dependent nitrite reductase membrane component NrfD